ncbi:MAG: GNAT family N-acetyltransferase [Filifactoraceae bacterium]
MGCKSIMNIRKATKSDLDQVENLYNELCDYLDEHENYPGWKKGVYPIRDDAEKGLRENTLFVVQKDENIVGTFVLKHEPEEGYKDVEWLTINDYSHIYVINTLAVHPKHLKYGIGGEILKFIENVAKEEKCISLRLDVVKGNLPAELLYQKNGYHFIGTVSLGYEEYGLPWYNLYEKVL